MKTFTLALALLSMIMVSGITGCAGTMKAIEHSSMSTKVRMSDSIILDVQNMAKNRTVYVKVTNTSEMQEIGFEDVLKGKLSSRGYSLTNDPAQAGYIVQANVLYMDYAKESMTADAMAVGGFGGALLGSGVGGGFKENIGGALVGGIIGSLAGAAIGKMVHVDNFIGIIDVQIQEKVAGGVTGVMKSDIKQGSSTAITTTKNIETNYQTYRTRIAAEAIQTNIDKNEAARLISEKVALQISGIF